MRLVVCECETKGDLLQFFAQRLSRAQSCTHVNWGYAIFKFDLLCKLRANCSVSGFVAFWADSGPRIHLPHRQGRLHRTARAGSFYAAFSRAMPTTIGLWRLA